MPSWENDHPSSRYPKAMILMISLAVLSTLIIFGVAVIVCLGVSLDKHHNNEVNSSYKTGCMPMGRHICLSNQACNLTSVEVASCVVECDGNYYCDTEGWDEERFGVVDSVEL